MTERSGRSSNSESATLRRYLQEISRYPPLTHEMEVELARRVHDGDDEAVALANDSDYGLAAGVWTDDVRRAHRMARALDCGTVWVNTYNRYDPGSPFGGFKQSGNGRDKSMHAFDDYTELKTTWIEPERSCRWAKRSLPKSRTVPSRPAITAEDSSRSSTCSTRGAQVTSNYSTPPRILSVREADRAVWRHSIRRSARMCRNCSPTSIA